ncbi:MAG: hypothetical protein ACXVEE_16800 [Polyangiales bacterium]
MRSLSSLSVLAILALFSATALAQQPDKPTDRSSHAYARDGLFLRMALGGGGLVSHDRVNDVATDADADISAGGGAFEASFGGAIRPGLNLGGSLIAQAAELGSVKDSQGSTSLRTSAGFVLLGGTLDLYPDAGSGFHVSGTLGPAAMSITDNDRVNRRWYTSGGLGLSLAAGYDWWIAPKWSVGFLVRATGARLWGTTSYDEATDRTTTEPSTQRSVGTMSIAFSALYQ